MPRAADPAIRTTAVTPIIDMMRRLNVADDDWDVCIVGDGSGQMWDIGAGWGGVVIDKRSRMRKLVYGGMNCGTVFIAEMMPYLHGLMWYYAWLGEHVEHRKPLIKVHCVTDNEGVATVGHELRGGRVPGHVKKQRELWMAMASFAQRGILLDFTHVPRSEIALNVYTDDVSRKSRLVMQNVALPTHSVTGEDGKSKLQTVSIYNVNCDDFASMGKEAPTNRRRL